MAPPAPVPVVQFMNFSPVTEITPRGVCHLALSNLSALHPIRSSTTVSSILRKTTALQVFLARHRFPHGLLTLASALPCSEWARLKPSCELRVRLRSTGEAGVGVVAEEEPAVEPLHHLGRRHHAHPSHLPFPLHEHTARVGVRREEHMQDHREQGRNDALAHHIQRVEGGVLPVQTGAAQRVPAAQGGGEEQLIEFDARDIGLPGREEPLLHARPVHPAK